MGVIHKLNPEVRDFIIKQKSSNPALSCRKLTALVLNNYKIDLSKSSINMIIKEAGLSAPVGRTPKKKRQHIVMPKLPVLLEDSRDITPVVSLPRNDEAIVIAKSAPPAEIIPVKEEIVPVGPSNDEAAKESLRLQEEKIAQEKARILEEESRKEEIRKAQELAEQEIKVETERLKALQLEEEKKRQEEELRKSEEEARKIQEEATRKAEEEAVKAAEAERIKAQEAAAKIAEEERKLKEEELSKVQEEASRRIKEEVERRAVEDNRLREEEVKRSAESGAAKKAQEEAEKKAREEAAKKAEEDKRAQLAEEEKKEFVFPVEKFPQLENSGIIFLRAIDSIIGLSKLFSAAIKSRLPKVEGSLDDITESLIYLPLVEGKIEKALEDKLSACLNEIENIKVMNLDISRIMTLGLQEARCVKVNLADGTSLYVDGQFYSVWSSPHIPYDFASPLHNLKKQINKYLNTDSPCIFFNAPGYDIPSQEFFNFLSSLNTKGKTINSLTIYGNKLDELEILPISQTEKKFFIFGVWPWQFTECRKVKSIGEFRPFYLEEQERDVFIADIEMDLRNPGTGKQMSLSGCALKTSLNEKTRLVILSNFASEDKKSEEVVSLYLSHWPNLDEAFQDYSRKIELFTYTANSQRYFNAAKLNLGLDQVSSVKDLFRSYLEALDAYLRWHFLPAEYEDKRFAVTKERFYDLGASIDKKEANSLAKVILPKEGYSFDKDLAYLCRRINERETFLDGKRFLARA